MASYNLTSFKYDGDTYNLPGTGGGGGGGSYSATAPISISNDTISHDTSGVTAGTYNGGWSSKSNMYYLPTFTVDATGHVTAASQTTSYVPRFSYSSPTTPGLVDYTDAFRHLYTGSTISSDCTIVAGNTSTTYSVSPAQGVGGYVVDVVAWYYGQADPDTGFRKREGVLVDWYQWSYGGSVTVSIAEPFDYDIYCNVIIKYYYSVM